MIARVVAWSGRHPVRVLAAAALLAGASAIGQRGLSRDVLPDLSDPQVVVLADWMGHPAMEVAGQVTQPLTDTLHGVPGSTAIRGQSMSGMAYLTVIFGSASEIAAGRAEIAARVEKVRPRLPSTVRVQVGPEASSTGWIYQYTLMPPGKTRAMPMGARRADTGPASLFGLRRFQDDVLRPQLAAISGVAEVASLGGETQELLIETTPDQLGAAGVAYSDLVAAARGAIATPGATVDGVKAAPLGVAVNHVGGVPVADVAVQGARAGGADAAAGAEDARIRRVADVRVAPAMGNGMADVDGARPVVAGIVIAKRDANVEEVLRKVRDVIEQERKKLPDRGPAGRRLRSLGARRAGTADALSSGRRGDRRGRLGGVDVSRPPAQRPHPDADAAARRPADVRRPCACSACRRRS